MTLTLYTNPMSRGRTARWMLEEVGAPYEEAIIPYEGDRSALLAVNPMGKVPAVVHDGRTVTETAAICAYLADTFPEAGLAPRPDERAAYYRWLFFAAGPLEAAIADRMLGAAPEGRQQGMVGYGTYDRAVDVLAGALSGTPHVASERFTAADVYVGAQVIWGLAFGSLPDRPEFRAYAERLTARDALRRAAAKDDALMPAPAEG